MLSIKNLTVAKKISLLSICALSGMLIIIAVSVVVFGKINQVGSITEIGKQYAIRYYKAGMVFQRFVRTNNQADVEEFTEIVNQMTRMDGSIVRIYRLYEKHGNVKGVLKAYDKKYGLKKEYEKVIQDTVKLFKVLDGNPMLDRLIDLSIKGNSISSKWLQLGQQYKEAGDAEKARIESQLTATGQELMNLLGQYNGQLETIANHFKSLALKMFLIIGFFMMAVMAIVTILVVKSIIKPLRATVDFAKSLSQGDLTQKIAISNKDEFGEMSGSLNQMGEILAKMLKEITDGTSRLSSAATKLSTISDQMTKDTKDTSLKAADVAAAADQMSDSMRIATTAMQEGTNNAGIMATAAEEMSSTIDEISKSAERASTISSDANEKTGRTTIQMNELGQAATGIGKVVEAITEISEQVNLLALNATIEAARAGEAGKGFAVVANEIKELARQTAAATQDIKLKIETIQNTTASTISQTQEISEVIGQVNDMIIGIATAVEEQSAATREIASNILKTTKGIEEIGEHVSNTSQGTADINAAISEVNQSTEQIADSSYNVNLSAADLSSLSEELTRMVSRFRL